MRKLILLSITLLFVTIQAYGNYPVESYTLTNEGKTLSKWLGTETEIDMNSDDVLKDVTSIYASAFISNTTLVSINIGSKVVSIGQTAFQQASKLEVVTMGNSVTTMGASVFNQCPALRTVTLSENLTELPRRTFRSCPALATFNIPSGLTYIGEECFASCAQLVNLDFSTMPIVSINYLAFNTCSGLKTIKFPSTLTSIGYGAFRNCSVLESITLKSTTPPVVGVSETYPESAFIPAARLSVCKLYVPSGAIAQYENEATIGWRLFENIEVDTTTVNSNPLQRAGEFKVYSKNGKVYIECIENDKQQDMFIYNVTGEEVFRSVINNSHAVALKTGLYILRINEVSKKIIVN